jgi:hypothetical protein
VEHQPLSRGALKSGLLCCYQVHDLSYPSAYHGRAELEHVMQFDLERVTIPTSKGVKMGHLAAHISQTRLIDTHEHLYSEQQFVEEGLDLLRPVVVQLLPGQARCASDLR